MNDTDLGPPTFSISTLLKDYRLMAGLSQDGLAALSGELLAAGELDRAFPQSQIARWENPERIERLREESITALAVLLAHALHQAGYDGAKAQELRRHLIAANQGFIEARTVSVFALEMDALMSPWPRWIKDIARHTIRQILIGTDSILKAHIARTKRTVHNQNNAEE